MAKKNLQPLQPGERTAPDGKPVSNRLLLALPDEEYRSLRPALEFLSLPQHTSLHEPDQKIENVYFPNRGLISLVVVMHDGKTVEVGVLGREGFAGAPAIFGLRHSHIREVVQIAGDGFQMPVEALKKSLLASPLTQAALARYSMVLGMQISQTAACNRLHEIERRLARWLLMAQDRVDSEAVAITHDFLATMLGTDRPSVSLAAANLQRRQIIDYSRGTVRILNRKNLEESACECYQAIQRFNGVINLK